MAIPRINGTNPLHGISLMKHILSGGKDQLPERTVFWELTGKVAVRKGKWKLVGQVEATRGNWQQIASELRNAELELYDLEKDISEADNLREKNPAQYAELKKELVGFFENIK